MAELKTKVTTESVKDFLNKVEPEAKRADGLVLLEMFEKATGEKPVMWGTSIVGFGTYHYKSSRSTQEGDWMIVGFSPRKQNLTLYVSPYDEDVKALIPSLGKCKLGGGCLYINKLADVDLDVLTKLIKTSFNRKLVYAIG